ncbi:Rne/Rng family ribonuclease [Persephonella sp.]
MNRELLIISSKHLYLYVIYEDKEPVEIRVEYKDIIKQSGNIYKGKIKRLVPAMNAAFVDIGEDREAFLPVKDVEECKNLKVGNPVLVQVKRSPVNTKGAKLTCKITLPGKYLVLMPTVRTVSISSKIEEKEIRERLKEEIKELLEPFNEKKYGFIIRTFAVEASEEAIIEDFLNLKHLWENILRKSKNKRSPSLIFEENHKIFSILRDYAGEFSRITTDNVYILNETKDYVKKHFPDKNIHFEIYKNKKVSPYNYYQIDRLINKILSPYVWLRNGGYIVIEETEALVTIDVNSGSHCKHKSLEETAYHTNVEAAREIARQLRLRDLGGIIIIDFIDMKSEERKQALIEFFKNEVKKDKRPVKIKDFTSLGLLELTRKKMEESLTKQLSDICDFCKGRGYVKNINLFLFEIENRINELKPFTKIKIKVNPKLTGHIKKFIKSIDMEEQINIEYDINLPMDKFIIEREE